MKGFTFKEKVRILALIFIAYFSTQSYATGMGAHSSLGCMSCHMGEALQAEVLPKKAKEHLPRPRQTKPTTATALDFSSKKTH